MGISYFSYVQYNVYCIFKVGNFHEFHRSIAIHENFALEIFPTASYTYLSKYFKHIKMLQLLPAIMASPRATAT